MRTLYGDSLTVTTEPASEPITVDELRSQIASNMDDGDLALYISAARQRFEFLTEGRICLPTTFKQYFEGWEVFPGHRHFYGCSRLQLRLGTANVRSITNVKYIDTNEVEQTLTGYATDLTSCPAIIYMADGVFPPVSFKTIRPINVTFVAGWADANHVPAAVKLALRALGAHYSSVREAYGSDDFNVVPDSFVSFCAQYRTGLWGI